MFKVEGFDSLSRKLEEIEKMCKELDGDLGEVEFDPSDPDSIERAIVQMEQTIDGKVGTLDRSDVVANLVAEMKDRFRTGILDKAAEARLKKKGS